MTSGIRDGQRRGGLRHLYIEHEASSPLKSGRKNGCSMECVQLLQHIISYTVQKIIQIYNTQLVVWYLGMILWHDTMVSFGEEKELCREVSPSQVRMFLGETDQFIHLMASLGAELPVSAKALTMDSFQGEHENHNGLKGCDGLKTKCSNVAPLGSYFSIQNLRRKIMTNLQEHTLLQETPKD